MSALTGKASGRAALVLLAVGTALVMLVSVFVSGATAAEPELVGPIEGDTCRALDYGVDAIEFIVPTGTRYKETFTVLDDVTVELEARPNRKYVEFTVDGATVNGGIIWNRIDQVEGNEYDYRTDDPAGTTEGRLEPPPRDSGNEKKIVLCFDFRTDVAIDKVTAFGTGQEADSVSDYIPAGDDIVFEYRVSIPGEGPAESLRIDSVTDSDTNVTPTFVSGDSNSNDLLDQGETWLYTSGTLSAVEDEYTNRGSVSAVGVSSKRTVTDDDDSGYFGVTTSVLSLSITNNGVGEENYIDEGEQVDWTIKVGNTVGNAQVGNVVVRDAVGTTVCDLGTIAESSEKSCTTTETAAAGENALSLWVSASGICPSGACDPTSVGPVSETYFGVVINVSITAETNGIENEEGQPPVVSDENVVWTVTVINNSNVDLTIVVGSQDGEPGASCTIDLVEAMTEAECSLAPQVKQEGLQTEVFTVNAQSPTGPIEPVSSDPTSYYGGFDCGESTSEGGPLEIDSPYVGLWIGPLKGGEPECAIPVEITSSNTQSGASGEQVVTAGPPSGFNWDGFTGVITIEWDVEDPVKGLLIRTMQRLVPGDPSSDIDIPVCGGPAAVAIRQVPGEFFFQLYPDPTAIYDFAVPNGGDTCLIQTTTVTITTDPDGPGGSLPTGSYSQTTEVFYLYNDPGFIRK